MSLVSQTNPGEQPKVAHLASTTCRMADEVANQIDFDSQHTSRGASALLCTLMDVTYTNGQSFLPWNELVEIAIYLMSSRVKSSGRPWRNRDELRTRGLRLAVANRFHC